MQELKNSQHTKVKVVSLIGKNAITINNALLSFNKYDEESGYSVYLFDESLCRGLDVKTSPKIEDFGGVHVIIAKIPTSTKVLEQAIGRTQRLIFKG